MNYYDESIIVDVTKPPYNCDNTGKEDCTEALCRLFDDILQREVDATYATWDKLKAHPDPNYRISFEVCKNNGVCNVIFPEDLPDTKIMYFPKGTYLVSDTISHSLEDLKNVLSGKRIMEINRKIYIIGEDKNETVIKLKDNCKGFGFGKKTPVISFMQTEQTNIAMTNTLANLTIDVGSGNSGAVGVKFNSSNSGAIRNVNFISSDDNKNGAAGVMINTGSESYMKDVYVDGFDYAFEISNSNLPVTLENIVVKNQKVTGFLTKDSTVVMYNYTSENKVCPFRALGTRSMVALIKAKCTGGDGLASAIVIASGEGYIRDCLTEGYRWPLIIGSNCDHFDNYIKEASTSSKVYAKFETNGVLSLNLPIEDTPEDYEPQSRDDIAYVDDFGAVGDGVTDCTQAIQKALDSGKPYIIFGRGHYLMDGCVSVPKTVKTINFAYCDFYSTEKLTNSKNVGVFKINEESEEHITFKNVFSFEKFYGYFRFIEHGAKRTVVLKDLHTQCAGMYFNTVRGSKVFVENCACTMGGDDYCTVVPYEFVGQKVWCRGIDPERGDIQILNDASDLVILGMKTETHVGRFASTAVKNINGGRVECFGVNSGIGGHGIPYIINEESQISAFFNCNASSKDTNWDIIVRDTKNGETRELLFDECHPISWFSCRVPGYVSI